MSRATYQREWAGKNAEKVKKIAARSYEKHKTSRREKIEHRKQERKALVWELKTQPCVDCGGRFHPAAMDFDHVRGEKLHTVAALMYSGTLEQLYDEIAKCELVCSNCHRVRTHDRRIN